MPGFVHLHVHSVYSLLEGALRIARLVDLARGDRQPALALTDSDNMFGMLEFSAKSAAAGVQPIVGCALAVDFGDVEPNPRSPQPAAPGRLVLLATREGGYRSLMRLNSRAFLETPTHQRPHIKLDWLKDECDELIALSGGPDGPLAQAALATPSLARARAERLSSMFGDRLYVELQRHGLEAERNAEPVLIDLAYDMGLPLVAPTQPSFGYADD